MAAAMASAMPVLPEVASIRVSPGLMSPRASARWIIDRAGRSLTEPAGLLPSSLARMTLPRASLSAPGMRTRRTSGVLPTKSCRVLSMLVQPLDILGNALLDRGHRRLVTGCAQVAQVGLGEGLVLALQGFGESGVFEQALAAEFRQRERRLVFGLAAAVDRRHGDIVEALRPPGAEVENPRLFRMVQEEEIDLGHIADEHEVAHLAAVFVAVRAFEQLHLAFSTELVEVVEGHRGHAPLVVLARAIDVEIAEADDLRRRVLGQALTHDLVEQELRITVAVERAFVLTLFLEDAAGAIGSGRRSVEELDVLVLAPVEQDHGVTVVVLHHVAAIGFHGVGTGAFVQDGLDLAVVMTGLDAGNEILLVDVIGDVAIDQVLELVGLGQVVDRDDVLHAALIERLDDGGTNETGGTGHDDIGHERSLKGCK